MTQNKNIRIAITGGIGSGKSTVSDIIRGLGFPVYSCDEIYRELLGNECFSKKIAAEFPAAANVDGTLDRVKLSGFVFDDDRALAKLNLLTHQEIFKSFDIKSKSEDFVFCEVPLLFEGGYARLFDDVIVVLREINSRIDSVVQRDGIDSLSVKKRIKKQFSYDKINFEEYYVIHNEGSLSDLRQITEITVRKISQKYFKKN